jgi:hypothetical protein
MFLLGKVAATLKTPRPSIPLLWISDSNRSMVTPCLATRVTLAIGLTHSRGVALLKTGRSA